MRITWSLVVLACASVAAADTVTAEKSTNLRRDKNTMSPVVAPVAKGQKLPVIKREGKWIFAESQGKQGWAAESWLKADAGMGRGAANLAALLSGDAQAGPAGEGAAVSGLEPLTMRIARDSGQDASGIDRLIRLRENLISSGEFERFTREGNVGPGRQP
ncbi:MAG: hypothetical protein NZ561_12150 [Phycisphaerae bacterium]|nr:hypothetical protein [Phycisphaerae bacterium]MDW8262747.1 hypothetical protein [Phycisphaerales bacterium]